MAGGSSAGGTAVRLDDCNGTGAQRWSYDASTGDVVNLAALKCLDVTDNSPANGARAQVWSCTGAANQKWKLRQEALHRAPSPARECAVLRSGAARHMVGV